MDSRMGLIGLVQVALVVLAALLQCTAAATTHVVGDSTEWRIPQGGAQFYVNWASGKTFRVGDTLSFAFTAQQHDVAKVTKAEYDACTATNPIGTILTTSPANVTLNTTGSHYYICAVSGHCSAGQKLTVNAIPSSTTAPSSPPVVPPTLPPAPAVPPRGTSPSPSPSPIAPSGPSPPPTSSTNPSPAPAPAPMAPTGTPPPPMAPTGPPPSPTAPTGPSPSNNGPTGSPPPPTTDGPTGSPPPPTTGGPPAPSSAFSLTAGFRSVGFPIAMLLISFL